MTRWRGWAIRASGWMVARLVGEPSNFVQEYGKNVTKKSCWLSYFHTCLLLLCTAYDKRTLRIYYICIRLWSPLSRRQKSRRWVQLFLSPANYFPVLTLHGHLFSVSVAEEELPDSSGNSLIKLPNILITCLCQEERKWFTKTRCSNIFSNKWKK